MVTNLLGQSWVFLDFFLVFSQRLGIGRLQLAFHFRDSFSGDVQLIFEASK